MDSILPILLSILGTWAIILGTLESHGILLGYFWGVLNSGLFFWATWLSSSRFLVASRRPKHAPRSIQ